jgi:hypothetical protein
MPWKKNPAVRASGISAKEYADAVKDGVRQGGGSKGQAQKAGAKAYKSAK